MTGSPGDSDLLFVERLAKSLERRSAELDQLVKEQHAAMRQSDFPWPHRGSPTYQAGGRDGVMRGPERTVLADRSGADSAG